MSIQTTREPATHRRPRHLAHVNNSIQSALWELEHGDPSYALAHLQQARKHISAIRKHETTNTHPITLARFWRRSSPRIRTPYPVHTATPGDRK